MDVLCEELLDYQPKEKKAVPVKLIVSIAVGVVLLAVIAGVVVFCLGLDKKKEEVNKDKIIIPTEKK